MHTPSVRSTVGLLSAIAALTMSASVAGAKPTQMAPIPLQWKPSGEVKTNVAAAPWLPSKIVVTSLRDTRPHPDLVGENHEDEQRVLTVTTPDNVAGWTKDRLNEVFANETHGSGPEVRLSGEIERLGVREIDDYNGEALLKLTARTPDGKVVWSGTLRGTASHFGRTYKAYNYDESLSDSLTAAAAQLPRDAAFVSGMKRAEH